jgi:hypothetical protein
VTKALAHNFVSAKASDADGTLVDGPKWNAGHEGIETYRVASDLTNATTTLASATGLALPIAASEIWHIRGILWYSSSATTLGIQLGASGPASPTNVIMSALVQTTVTAFTASTVAAFATKTPAAGVVAGVAATIYRVDFECTVENGANAGTVQIQFCASTTGTITLKRGSFIVCTQG